MSALAVSIRNLDFHYPGSDVLLYHNLDLHIKAGERFGLFGPNGAGKTTLMSLMTGLIEPDKGTISLLGHQLNANNQDVNKLFGFVPQDFSFYHELSPIENLEFFGAWAGLRTSEIKQRTNELLEILGLSDVRHKPVQKFSGGMKRRINLAIGVIHRPKVLFLDEPTVGVDVQTRHAIISYLEQLNREGTTLIYTSHQLNEAEDLCHEMALVDNGHIIAQGEIAQLLEQNHQTTLEGLFLNLTGRQYRD